MDLTSIPPYATIMLSIPSRWIFFSRKSLPVNFYVSQEGQDLSRRSAYTRQKGGCVLRVPIKHMKGGSAVRSVGNMKAQSCHNYQRRALSTREHGFTACRKAVLFRHQILCKAGVSSRAEHLQAKVLLFSTSQRLDICSEGLSVWCILCINGLPRATFARYRPKGMAYMSL